MVVPVEPTGSDASVQSAADRELHRRPVYGDESAPAEACTADGGLVRRIAVRGTHSSAAAEDVAQAAFAQLWTRPYAFDACRGAPRTWLAVPAHRRAVDRVRGEARHRKAAHADDQTPHTIPDAAPGPDRPSSIANAPCSCTPPSPSSRSHNGEVVDLACFAGRTHRRAAVELGIPEGTAKSRLRTALRTLAESLADPPDPALERGA